MLELQIQRNKRRTIYLMIVFTILIVAIGAILGFFVLPAGTLFGYSFLPTGEYFYWDGAIIGAIVVSALMVIYLPITYWTSGRQTLALSGSKEATPSQYPELYSVVEELVLATQLPMPKVYVINDPSPNAFATGTKPEKAGVSVTTGLLDTLNKEELRAVVAHELAHIRNYDIRLLTVTIALVSIIVLISEVGARSMMYTGGRRNQSQGGAASIVIKMVMILLIVILAPLAAQIVKLAVSRNREYLADATAMEFTRNPIAMQKALMKISGSNQDVQRATSATASMYISSPLKKKKHRQKKRAGLFDTHPPIASRIERLEQMYNQTDA